MDQGTTSTRVLVIDQHLRVLGSAQREHEQKCSQPGWCEHNPNEIYENVVWCLNKVISDNSLEGKIRAIGITNQRETTVAFDRTTGEPLNNAVVWLDKRTDGVVKDMLSKYSLEEQEQLR